MFDFKNIEKDIYFKKEGCLVNNILTPVNKYVNLYVQITNYCNCKCKFCSNTNNEEKFDKNYFFEVFDSLHENIFINKITFTGGEPTLSNDLLDCIKYIRKKNSDILVILDTNATNLDLVKELTPFVSKIALSRHHYLDTKNNEIFNFKTASEKNLNSLPISTKNKINLRCNLIKNYIDSEEECKNYLDWCNSILFNSVGFIKLMPYNQYSIDNFVSVDINKIENIELIKSSTRKNICACKNLIYKGKYGCVNLYEKEVFNKDITNNTLVLSNNKLKTKF